MDRAPIFARAHSEALAERGHEALRRIETRPLGDLIDLSRRVFTQESASVFELLAANVFVGAFAYRLAETVLQPSPGNTHMNGQFLHSKRMLNVLKNVIYCLSNAAVRNGDHAGRFTLDDPRGRYRCKLAGFLALE